MTYRHEIDGLRAVAVLSVILSHAGLGWMPGGFAGVDAFFVISGFLITGIISRDLGQGRFTFRNFYARRARRILPALFFMLSSVSILAWLHTFSVTKSRTFPAACSSRFCRFPTSTSSIS